MTEVDDSIAGSDREMVSRGVLLLALPVELSISESEEPFLKGAILLNARTNRHKHRPPRVARTRKEGRICRSRSQHRRQALMAVGTLNGTACRCCSAIKWIRNCVYRQNVISFMT